MDSVFKTGKNYYPQVFLEECKYAGKEKKDAIVYYQLEKRREEKRREDSDEKISSEKKSDEENSNEEN